MRDISAGDLQYQIPEHRVHYCVRVRVAIYDRGGTEPPVLHQLAATAETARLTYFREAVGADVDTPEPVVPLLRGGDI